MSFRRAENMYVVVFMNKKRRHNSRLTSKPKNKQKNLKIPKTYRRDRGKMFCNTYDL